MRRSTSTRWRRVVAALVAPPAAVAAAGCASAPQPRQLGQYAALMPRLAVIDSEHPPVNLTVDLSAPASVVVMYVAPGRSTRIVYPADTLGAPRLAAGSQRITATWPRPRVTTDSARRDSVTRGGQARARRDSIARAGAPRAPAPLPDPEAGLAPTGYLLLFATPAPLRYAEVRRKVEGVTTPLDTDEALNAIAKQVRSTLDPSAQWAGYAVEVTAQADELRGPPRNPRTR
ncbi:MAG: hypothetical protein ABR499_12280 [Gemmatimonadaceae bacterium]